jgi:RNA polymerase sigma factor (sigma-70 family)
MEDRQLGTILRHLQRFTACADTDTLTDGELLERFARLREESAFAALFRRHGSLVYNVCRRVLRHAQDAEDAVQATFLLLVRKASSIHKQEALAGWLYKVAYRIALRARAESVGRAVRELPDLDLPADEGPDEVVWRDLRAVLDEEVNRLPTKYRLPVVLCYLGGQTTEEAARQLGCPKGTVLSRLSWARGRLRTRLVRRGVAVSAAALATALSKKAAAAMLPGALRKGTIEAALAWAAGNTTPGAVVSARAISLMEGVLHAMFLDKLKTAAIALLAVALLGVGIGLWAYHPATAEPLDKKKDETSHSSAEPASSPRPRDVPHPIGTWEREVGPFHITLRVEADHVSATATGADKEQGSKVTYLFDADYSVTRDSVLFGVITGAEITGNKLEEEGQVALLVDQPFSLRLRLDDNVLTIKDLKFMNSLNNNNDEIQDIRPLLLGRNKKKAAAGKETTW